MGELGSTWGLGRSVRIAEGFRYRLDLLLALLVVDVFGAPLGDEIVLKFPTALSTCAER